MDGSTVERRTAGARASRPELFQEDADGRIFIFGTVTIRVMVGHDDGGDHIVGASHQAFDDGGLAIPTGGVNYWIGGAMDRMTYMNIAAIPDKMVTTTMMSVPPPLTRPGCYRRIPTQGGLTDTLSAENSDSQQIVIPMGPRRRTVNRAERSLR